jgi:hypothetical protein
MKKILVLGGLVGLMVAQQCFAINVNVNRYAGYFNSAKDGGESTITAVVEPDSAFDAIYKNYANVATYNGGFETFCIAPNLHLLGNPQSATLQTDGVSLGTAWLYSMFAHGTLNTYGYVYTVGSGREAAAWGLQNAIWVLQGFGASDATAAQPYLAAAIGQFGTLAAAEALANGQYGVDALILTYGQAGGQVSQPMLALVPDGGSTLMLLGIALSGLSALSRRFRS